MMRRIRRIVCGVVSFYYEGFRHMTTGRILWGIILIKLFVFFVILRIFFFKPAMKGLSPQQKQNRVAAEVVATEEQNRTVNFKK